MTNQQELYKQHFNDMCRSSGFETADEKEIDRLLNRLISCLPNEGRFYKYRMGNGQGYDYAVDSISKGYIWLAKANTLNDDFDTTINFDPSEEINSLKCYLIEHPDVVLVYVYRLSQQNTNNELFKFEHEINNTLMEKVTHCFDYETGELQKSKAIPLICSYGYTKKKAHDILTSMENWVESYIADNEAVLSEIAQNYLSFNQKIRSSLMVFSLSECYDTDAMWGYYADNTGFCIEYDFKKALKLPVDIKRKILNFYMVSYSSQKEKCSFLPYIKWILEGKKDFDLLFNENRALITQLLTKQKDWSHEKEWRLVLCNIDNRFYAELVSGLYIDKSMLDTENGKKLLKLANEKSWNVFCRKTNLVGTEHEYVKVQ